MDKLNVMANSGRVRLIFIHASGCRYEVTRAYGLKRADDTVSIPLRQDVVGSKVLSPLAE